MPSTGRLPHQVALSTLQAIDQAPESWLHTKIVTAYHALMADPTVVVSVDEVRSRLSAKYSN